MQKKKKKLIGSVCTQINKLPMTATQFETKRLLNTEAMKLKKIPTE